MPSKKEGVKRKDSKTNNLANLGNLIDETKKTSKKEYEEKPAKMFEVESLMIPNAGILKVGNILWEKNEISKLRSNKDGGFELTIKDIDSGKEYIYEYTGQEIDPNDETTINTNWKSKGKYPDLVFPLQNNKEKLEKEDREQKDKKEYWNTIKEIAELIKKNGIEKVVIHGNEIKDKNELKKWRSGYAKESEFIDEGPAISIDNDLDTTGALYLLKKIQEKDGKIFKEGSSTEIIPKGTDKTYNDNNKKNGLILYIDVGGKNPKVLIDDGKIKIFADHHGEEGGYTTSATQIMLDIAKISSFELGKDEEEKDLLANMGSFVAKFDNLTYLNEKKDFKNPDSGNLVDEKYLVNTFSRSLYSLAKFLPFETVLDILGKGERFLKNGKPRSWDNTFTRNEMENGFGEMLVEVNGKKLKLRDLIVENEKKIKHTIVAERNTERYMQDKGIDGQSPIIGKFLYHNFPEIEAKGNKKGIEKIRNIIPNELAYITARGLGYDSFVSYSPKDGRIFVNSDGKMDLMKLWKKLNEIVPGYPKPVRNQMLFGPKDPEMLKLVKEKITEEKFLEILKGSENKVVEVKAEETTPTTVVEPNKEPAPETPKVEKENLENLEEKHKAAIQADKIALEVLKKDSEKREKLKEARKIVDERLAEIEQKKTEEKEKEKQNKSKIEYKTIKEMLESSREDYFNAKNEKETFGSKFKKLFGGKTKKEKNIEQKKQIYDGFKKDYLEGLHKNGKDSEMLDFLIKEKEEFKKNEIENSKFKEQINKTFSWYEKQNKLTKIVIQSALIGGSASMIVASLAAVGVGSAAALGGGVATYVGKRAGISLLAGGIADKIPGGKYLSILSYTSIAGLAGVGVKKGSKLLEKKLGVGNEKIEEKKKEVLAQLENKKFEATKTLEEKLAEIEGDFKKLNNLDNKKLAWKTFNNILAVGTAVATLEAVGANIENHRNDTEIKNENKTEEAWKGGNKENSEIKNWDKTNHTENNLNHKEIDDAFSGRIPHENTTTNDAIVHKGEGIENPLIRQIENDKEIAKSLGWDEKEDLHKFAGIEAHKLAIKEGYVDANGNQTFVTEANKVAYEIHNENGKITIEEKVFDGEKFIHGEANKYEYKSNENISHEEKVESEIKPEKPNFDNQENNERVKDIYLDKNLHEITPEKPHFENEHKPNNETEKTDFSKEELEKIHKIHDDNLGKLLKNNDKIWEAIKSEDAKHYLNYKNNDDGVTPEFRPFVNQLNMLHKESGLEPKEATIFRDAESLESYMIRAEEKIAREHGLDTLKIKK